MAYWKKWRRTDASLRSLVHGDKSDEDDTISDDINRIAQECPSNTEEGHQASGNCDEVLVNIFNEDNDFGFSEGISSESEGEMFEEESEDDKISDDILTKDLAAWATEFKLTREGLNSLLGIIRKQGHTVPKDARTLLQTPRTVEVLDKCGGQYKYYGIEDGLMKVFEQNPFMAETVDPIKMLVNIDGIPIFKSCGTQFWPILCSIENKVPFLVALFYGSSKPTSVQEFLHDFLEELSIIQRDGFLYESKRYIIVLSGFVCDAPARALLKCIKGHTGYYSCERCIIKGYYKSNRVIFYSTSDFAKRTNEDFCQQNYEDHQLRKSPLSDYGINCIENFCLDYMHLVCLGVVKRILSYLKNGPKECKLSSSQVSQISDALVELNGLFPSEFARQPRSLYELERWKATEFRQFLLYSGPVVLKKVVSKKLYEHFLALAVAVSILLDSNDEKRIAYMNYAKQLLQYFVYTCKDVYTDIFVSYNVHNLVHLTDDVEHFNCSLNRISAFPFENHLQGIKRLVRNAKNPLVQVSKRLTEINTFQQKVESANTRHQIAFISTRKKDNCFLLHNEDFAFVKEKRQDGNLVCNIIKQRDAKDFFDKPCGSKLMNIVYVDKRTRSTEILLQKSDLFRKVVNIPYSSGNVLFPLLHGVERRI